MILSELRQDLGQAIRQLPRHPGFAAMVVLTLALGIGINTVVFSLVNALLLRPVAEVQEPERMVALYTAEREGRPGVSSYMDYRDFRLEVEAFRGLAAFKHVDGRGLLLAGAGAALGVLGTLGVSRLLSGLLYGVRPVDPLTLIGAVALLALTTALASWLPARRAARVDPMIALRAE